MVAQACNPNAEEVETKGFLGSDDHQARVFGEFQESSLRDSVSKKTKWTDLRSDTRKLTTHYIPIRHTENYFLQVFFLALIS